MDNDCKRFTMIMLTYSNEAYLTKDACSYAYALGKYCGWKSAYAYFSAKPLKNEEVEKYCRLVYLGDEQDYGKEVAVAKKFCAKEAGNNDVIMLFNYGSTTYKLAKVAKKNNPKLKIYCKLDMSENGFRHFYDGTTMRKVKSLIELWKSRRIDLFTVENSSFYKVLKDTAVFKERIGYLPNGVSLVGVDVARLDKIEKENIVLTVGRLGIRQKNNELFLEAIKNLPRNLKEKWRFCFVGSSTDEFIRLVDKAREEDISLRDSLLMTGEIIEREKLYALYAKAKIFVLTSRNNSTESFGIVTVEAAYFGAYPILTDYGSVVRDITDGGRCGEVVPQGDAVALTNALSAAMTDENLPEKSRLCRDYARYQFDYSRWAVKLDEYLRGI